LNVLKLDPCPEVLADVAWPVPQDGVDDGVQHVRIRMANKAL
jgi:hypothetical protein